MAAVLSEQPVVTHEADDEKEVPDNQLERSPTKDLSNNAYLEDDEEPEIHARTWFALLSLFMLNLVQVFALT